MLRLIEIASKPFLEEEHMVDTLTFVSEARTHKMHKMESSTSGFWGAVKKHPMDIRNEAKILVVQVRHYEDILSADECAQLIKTHSCESLIEQCGKSCLKDSAGVNFVLKYWTRSPNDIDDDFTNDKELDDNYSSELGMSRWFMAVEKYVRYKAIMRGNRRKNAAIIIIL